MPWLDLFVYFCFGFISGMVVFMIVSWKAFNRPVVLDWNDVAGGLVGSEKVVFKVELNEDILLRMAEANGYKRELH